MLNRFYSNNDENVNTNNAKNEQGLTFSLSNHSIDIPKL